MQYNYYKASWRVVTVRRAQLMGIRVSHSFGYYVLIDPVPVQDWKRDARIQCWCKTKKIALDEVQRLKECQVKGYLWF